MRVTTETDQGYVFFTRCTYHSTNNESKMNPQKCFNNFWFKGKCALGPKQQHNLGAEISYITSQI